MAYRTVKLKNYGNIFNEYEANAAISPGMLVELMSTGKIRAHSTAGGNALRMFALENYLEGKDINDLDEKEFENLKINNINLIICEPLNESDKCFSDESKIYTNPDDRRNARDICWEKGNYLLYNNPLGFGDCQSIVVFPDTCPNNSLPILWAEKENFKPLFKRKIN